MKGITNAQIREKFEHIEAELSELKQMREKTNDESILVVSTIFALVATVFFFIIPHEFFLFFMVAGLSCMGFFVVKIMLEQKSSK